MKQENMSDQELLSALADDRLRDDQFARAVDLLESSAEHRSTWHAYHAIGDMVRTGEYQTLDGDSEFLRRFRMKVANERVPLKNALKTPVGTPESLVQLGEKFAPAVNDSAVRWKAWGGIFSVIAVSALVWQMFAGETAQPVLAQMSPFNTPNQVVGQVETSETLAEENQGQMIRDPRLDALLAAHQQMGGASAFQSSTGFVQSATFLGAGR